MPEVYPARNFKLCSTFNVSSSNMFLGHSILGIHTIFLHWSQLGQQTAAGPKSACQF